MASTFFREGASIKTTIPQKCWIGAAGLSENDAQRILGNKHNADLALGHWVAGIRELFEEVGVLLCETRSGAPIELRDETTKTKVRDQASGNRERKTWFRRIPGVGRNLVRLVPRSSTFSIG